jgi:hypothetical protein
MLHSTLQYEYIFIDFNAFQEGSSLYSNILFQNAVKNIHNSAIGENFQYVQYILLAYC